MRIVEEYAEEYAKEYVNELIEKNNAKIIKNMFKNGINPKTISKTTGLELEFVEKVLFN